MSKHLETCLDHLDLLISLQILYVYLLNEKIEKVVFEILFERGSRNLQSFNSLY